ncbi:hypothetical protein [Hyphomonas sp.]|uniref:hypothetical protein n=1 Tax=Hyphomonas sp. TaxID=87 RepID=UPI0025BA88EC|nr:hypothetical protein [Hyphomonas sp.]
MGDDVDPQFQRIFLELGRFAFCWAQLDFHLDSIVHAFFHLHGNPGEGKSPPSPLSQRIPFIQNALRRVVEDEQVLTRWIELLDDVLAEVDVRNHLLHGAITLIPDEPNVIHVARVKQHRTEPDLDCRTISLEDISDRSDRILNLVPKVQLVATELYQIDEGNA